MDELIDKFYNHKILMDVRDATDEDLKKIAEILEIKYMDNSEIYPKWDNTVNFLHCRGKGRYVTHSVEPTGFDEEFGIATRFKYVSFKEFLLSDIELSEDEFMDVYR